MHTLKRKCIIHISIAFILLATILITVIASVSSDKTVVIWTNNVDIVSYVEVFNSENPQSTIVVKYRDNVAGDLLSTPNDSLPDIAISPWIKNSELRKKFYSLNGIFDSKTLPRSSFYPQLLNLGEVDGRQFFIPISFNMPLIAYKKTDTIYDANINMNDIKEMSKNFKGGKVAPYMAFAPTWNGDFLYNLAKLQGANFAESGRNFTYNEDAIAKTVQFAKQWSEEVNSSVKNEDDFKFKYFFTNAESLLLDERVQFLYERSDTLLPTISGNSTGDGKSRVPRIGFSWISIDNKTVICDDTIFAGILRKSANKSLCKKFLKWLLNEETQKKLLKRQRDFNLFHNTFGFAGGFSSLPEVNRKVLPLFFPIVLDRLPEVSKLYDPYILPVNWEGIKNEVIIPYLEDSVRKTDTPSIAYRYQKFLSPY